MQVSLYTVTGTFKSFVHDFDGSSNVMTLTEKVNDLNFTLLVYSFIHIQNPYFYHEGSLLKTILSEM